MTYSFDLKIRMVNYYNNSNVSLRHIEKVFDISKSSLQRWVNDECFRKSTIKTKYKDRIKILDFIKRSLNHNPFQILCMLKIKISKKFNIELTTKTISNYVKIIGYSKKKITRRLYNKSLKDHILNRKKMKKVLKKIKKEDIICVDESGINRRLYGDHGWTHKTKRLVCHMSNKELLKSHSLIMAISNKKILKYELHKNKAINTDSYYLFLEDLLKKVKNKYILMDNVSFHKSKRIKELIEGSNNKLLFIPPYSPDFNPIEEVFSEMKAFLKKYINPLTMNRDINQLLKRFSKKEINLEGYYKHAFN